MKLRSKGGNFWNKSVNPLVICSRGAPVVAQESGSLEECAPIKGWKNG